MEKENEKSVCCFFLKENNEKEDERREEQLRKLRVGNTTSRQSSVVIVCIVSAQKKNCFFQKKLHKERAALQEQQSTDVKAPPNERKRIRMIQRQTAADLSLRCSSSSSFYPMKTPLEVGLHEVERYLSGLRNHRLETVVYKRCFYLRRVDTAARRR